MKRNSNKRFVFDRMVLLLVEIILLIVALPWFTGLIHQRADYVYTGLVGELWSD